MYSLNTPNNSLYFFEGQNLPWANDAAPPIPVDTVQQATQCWNNMLFGKLITLNSISLESARYNWTNNNVYTAYSDTNPNLFSSQYYMITSNNEVYKCLANNNGGPSTFQPSGVGSINSNYIQTMADGYQWKYMLQVQPGDQFLNSQWFGVPLVAPPNSLQALIEASSVPGSIDVINVNSGGGLFTNGPQQFIVQITGDGSGANAYANVVANAVQNIVMVTRGQGYSYATITFTDPRGIGANATAVLPPPGGHGSYAAGELGSSTLMIVASAANSESGYLTTVNKFRQNGLFINPLAYGSNNVQSNARIQTCVTGNMSGGIGSYALNEPVYQGININTATFTGNIIDFDPIFLVARINNVTGTLAPGSILYGVTSGTQRYVSGVVNPDVQKYTGEFLEIDNELPIQRSATQTESFQYIIKF
jgi:hypothetical protein